MVNVITGSDNRLVPNRQQAITWTKDDQPINKVKIQKFYPSLDELISLASWLPEDHMSSRYLYHGSGDPADSPHNSSLWGQDEIDEMK